MGLLKGFFERLIKRVLPQRSFFGARNNSGVLVNEQNSLSYSAVFAAVRLITETISTTPVHLYRKLPDGRRERVLNHPLSSLISQPNPEMPWNVFTEVMQGHIETHGKAFAEIVHNRSTGYPSALWPVQPEHIQMDRDNSGKLIYKYTPTGSIVPQWKMFHVVGFGYNGVDSYSPISLARQSIGLGLAAEEFHARYYKQGAQLGGFVQMDGEMSDEAFERFKQQIDEKYRGIENSHGVIILENGAQFQPLKLSFDDAQFLESRKFGVVEIARWFGIKPHMIADLEHATFSNIEHQGMEAVRYTFRPRVVRWEQAMKKQLIAPFEQQDLYFKFSLDSLLRGDTKSRYEAYRIAIQDGWLNADEVRELEDLNPQPDGQGSVYFMPLNMAPKTSVIEGRAQNNTSSGFSAQLSAPSTPQIETVEPKKLITDAHELSRSLREDIRSSYSDSFQVIADEIVSSQVDLISSNLDVLKSEGRESFFDAMRIGYESIRSSIKEKFSPLIHSMADEIIPSLQREMDKNTSISSAIGKFVDEYVEAMSVRLTKSNEAQIRKLVETSDTSEQRQAVEGRLEEWRNREASKIVMNETVQSENAISRKGYEALGAVQLQWITAGSETCPICAEMSGVTVGIENAFVQPGQRFPDGRGGEIVYRHMISHPPLHQGCVCQIGAR